MRVRILRGASAGRVVDLPDAEAHALLEQGLVEEDKMLPDVPTETTHDGRVASTSMKMALRRRRAR